MIAAMKERQAPSPLTVSQDTAAKPASVLIVDDEASMLRYLRTVLELKSCQVETAASGS